MANKSIILITVLVVVLAATQAEAQLLPPVTTVFNVSGIVSCSVNGTTTAPPFPNALVQLSCLGVPIASSVTNATGAFSIIVTPIQSVLATLLSSCRAVVATPLASCNATLPLNGTLQAPLQFAGSTVRGLLNITNIVPSVFQLVGI